ncbi:MAG: hypothetical protein AAGN15_08210 [Cyanobacteria bacterium J06581_3]
MELATFTCQTFIFYMVAVLSSDLLSDKDRLVAYVSSRIGNIAVQELLIVVPVSFLVVGMLHTLSDKYSSRWAKRLIETVLQDIPRTIYLFGSSVAGVLLALSTFSHRSADPSIVTGSIVFLSVIAAITFFLYGCFVSYILK